MSKSRARKMREKRIREGLMDPVRKRGTYASADLRTRKTKTKHEVMYQNKYGELPKVDLNETDGSSFFCSRQGVGEGCHVSPYLVCMTVNQPIHSPKRQRNLPTHQSLWM